MRFLILIISFLIYSPQSNAQSLKTGKPTDSASIWKLAKYDATNTLQGVGYAFTRPLQWQKKDFQKLTTLAIGTFALSLADESANDFFNEQADNYPNIGENFGWYFGSPQNYFMINAGLYGFGLFTKNEKIRKTSVLIISSSITSGFIQTLSKTAFGRARPSSGFGHDAFDPGSSEANYHSFPSGHTVLAVTMAHAVAKQFDNVWLKIGIYSIGAIPPITRLLDGAHWLTDVAFSTALSIIVVDSIDKFLYKNDKYSSHSKPKKISWNLSFSSNQIGVVGVF